MRHLAGRVLRTAVGRPYVFVNNWMWRNFAAPYASGRIVRAYGDHLHRLNRLRAARAQSRTTFFFRNRPALELMIRMLEGARRNAVVSIAVAGCSKGAEVYSLAHAIRGARPDLELRLTAVDVSKEVLEFAEAGVYCLSAADRTQASAGTSTRQQGAVAANTSSEQPSSMFERMTAREVEELFVREGENVRIKPLFRADVRWRVGDAGDPNLVADLGVQDMVMANDFLCHMRPADAERCLRRLARLVAPEGYLFVAGVDLDVRTKVARASAWVPVTELIRDIHEGDPSLRQGWPLQYWGLEPFDPRRKDWQMRYASVFRMPAQEAADISDATSSPGEITASVR